MAALGDWDFPGPLVEARIGESNLYVAPGNRSDVTLFIGDSHIEQYAPRIVDVQMARAENINSAYFATAEGCPPIPSVTSLASGTDRCSGLRAAIELAKRTDVKVVVLGACWSCYFIDQMRPPHGSAFDWPELFFTAGTVKESFRSGRGAELAFRSLQDLLIELARAVDAIALRWGK